MQCELETLELRGEQLPDVFLDDAVGEWALLKNLGHLLTFNEGSGAHRANLAISVGLKDLAVETFVGKSLLVGKIKEGEIGRNARTSRSGEINLHRLGVELAGEHLDVQDLIGLRVFDLPHRQENVFVGRRNARLEIRIPTVAASRDILADDTGLLPTPFPMEIIDNHSDSDDDRQ